MDGQSLRSRHLFRATFISFFLVLGLMASSHAQALRKRSQVETILGPATDTAGPFAPFNIVLVWGLHDHAAGQHEYEAFAKQWQPLLARMHNTAVSLAYYWPSPEQWQHADLIVFYLRTHNCQSNTGSTCVPKQDSAIVVGPAQFAQLDDFLARGKGIATLHAANYPHEMYQDAWADRTGLAWKVGAPAATTTFREGTVALNFNTKIKHPILAGLPDSLRFSDEMYFPLFGHPDGITELATSVETFQGQAAPRTALWTYSPPGKPGRVYGFIMGHLQTSFDDPVFRILLLRGMAWAAGEGFGRFRRVVLDGAVYADDVVALAPRSHRAARGPAGQGPGFGWKGGRRNPLGRPVRGRG